MCGISCVVGLDGPSPHHHPGSEAYKEQRKTICRSLDTSLDNIKHRGPDDRGRWISDDNRVGTLDGSYSSICTQMTNKTTALGHVRLSINDLSSDGAQPLHSPDWKIHAVVNGEIYEYDRIREQIEEHTDYVFNSRSDSELVIALYIHQGIGFLNDLRGEFAVVLFDEEQQLLVAGRDRYGIKPLFWTIQQDPQTLQRKLLIAAEMKAFLPLGWTPEWDVRSLKDAGWNHDERTIFKGVQKVRPGNYLTCTGFGHVEQRQYWDIEFPDRHNVDDRHPKEMIQEVRERLLEAIKLRLRADVPIGVYLSGGIDSSVIAGMVTHLVEKQGVSMGSAPASERVCCFSIAFEEASGFDESTIALRTAGWLGVKFEKKLMNEEELAKRFEDATWHTEHHNPDLNYVGKFALSELPREAGYKVVLTGEGADEVFAGYPAFMTDYLRKLDLTSDPWNELSETARDRHFQMASNDELKYYHSVGANVGLEGPTVSRGMLKDISSARSMSAFQPDVFASWTDTAFATTDPQRTIANNVDNRTRQKIFDTWHPLHAAQYVWSKGHLANINLTCLGDRTEMAHSIEARTPFLDHHLTEYVNNLPPSVKVHYDPPTQGPGKYVDQESRARDIRNKDYHSGRIVEKWVLREAAKPFITPELYERKKHPYSAPTSWPVGGPLHHLLAGLLTKENAEGLGFVAWEKVEGLVDRAFGREGEARALRVALIVAQWVVLGKRFGVVPAAA